MLDIKFIREHKQLITKTTKAKNVDPSLVDKALVLDEKYKNLILEIDKIRAKRNQIAKGGKASVEGREIKDQLKEKESEFKEIEKALRDVLYKIPNVVAEDVPEGKDETENKVIRKWGQPKKFTFIPKDHVDLGKALGIIDTETASKVTGSSFNYLKGDAVLLQNALYQFVISVLTNEKTLKEIAEKTKKGYSAKSFIPVLPPLLIKPDIYEKMARLSTETEIERYAIPRDNQYLIGSAEHTLGPMHIDEMLEEKNLPFRYFAFTPAFRREAGSYGKDTKGILRQHQFDKIEMESFTIPEDGQLEQDFFVNIQEYLMQKLKIPYQVVAICTGDMGGPDYRQIDIEAWLPGQDKYRETHTADYMTDYQSRRLHTKVRMKNGEIKFVYMNDATVFAMGRIIISILENYQQIDGSIEIPDVLRLYLNNKKNIKNSNARTNY